MDKPVSSDPGSISQPARPRVQVPQTVTPLQQGRQPAPTKPRPAKVERGKSEQNIPKMPVDEWGDKITQAVNDDDAAGSLSELLNIRRLIIQKHQPAEGYGDDHLIECLFVAINLKTPEKDTIAFQLIDALGPKLAHPHGGLRRTALHQAVVKGRPEVVSDLLRHSECSRFVNIGDHNGRTAIHEAAARGNDEILERLLRFGAQLDVSDGLGMTPLHLVIWRRQELKEKDVKQGREEGVSEVKEEVKKEAREEGGKEGRDENGKEDGEETRGMKGGRGRRTLFGMVQELTNQGAEVNTRDQSGRNAPLTRLIPNQSQQLLTNT